MTNDECGMKKGEHHTRVRRPGRAFLGAETNLANAFARESESFGDFGKRAGRGADAGIASGVVGGMGSGGAKFAASGEDESAGDVMSEVESASDLVDAEAGLV